MTKDVVVRNGEFRVKYVRGEPGLRYTNNAGGKIGAQNRQFIDFGEQATSVEK